MKILQSNENDGLPVEIKWFNHLPIINEKTIPDDLKMKSVHIVQIIHSSR